MKKIYLLIVTVCLILTISSCVVNRITSVEFVSKPFQVVAQGENPKKDNILLLVCYNKYFNQKHFGFKFNSKNKLDTINYTKNMLVEIFCPLEYNISELKVDEILENKDQIKIYFSTAKKSNEIIAPYIIVQTPRSRKKVSFFHNGKKIGLESQNIYVK